MEKIIKNKILLEFDDKGILKNAIYASDNSPVDDKANLNKILLSSKAKNREIIAYQHMILDDETNKTSIIGYDFLDNYDVILGGKEVPYVLRWVANDIETEDGDITYFTADCHCEKEFSIAIDEHYKYCPNCGQRLKWLEEEK